MTWLVAAASHADPAALPGHRAWRDIRRFNTPVQLAVAAALDVATHARHPEHAALVSCAPCHAGSPELHAWTRAICATGGARMNPSHTLHAVDNLALSSIAIALANRGWGLSLGGGPGMCWTALELATERPEAEVLVVAGDQDDGTAPSPALGVALLFAREPRPFAGCERPVRLVAVERRRARAPLASVPHAARGLAAMLSALRAGGSTFQVPARDGDGLDEISIHWELA